MQRRIKTDGIDSETLAHLLRADLIPAAYAPSAETRAIKRVLRQRLLLVRVRTMIKNRITALLAQHSVARPELTDLYGPVGRQWLDQICFPDPDGWLLKEDLGLLDELSERITGTEALIQRLSADDPAVRWLDSLPGIGVFLSVVIRYEVDGMERFRTAKKFAS